MLYRFLLDNESDLIERCHSKAAERPLPAEARVVLQNGIPVFLRQLIRTLAVEQTTQPLRGLDISGPAGGDGSGKSEMGATATIHGRELLDRGFSIDQVVHAYGDVCQAITDLAVERGKPFQVDEFRTLNRCLDNAIADAVTEYASQQETLASRSHDQALSQRMGFLAHEMRNLIQTATLTFAAIKAGTVGLAGGTAGVMDRTLLALQRVVDGSISEVRMQAGMAMHSQLIPVASFIGEIKISAALLARESGCTCFFSSVDPDLAVRADRDLLSAAIVNLLQNAFKFTQPGTEVTLNAYASADRILIDVLDRCGGLPWSDTEKLFLPFAHGGSDDRGLGLGLSIVRRSVEANEGILRVHNRPGEGCIFTIDLPRYSVRNDLAEPRVAI